MFSLGETLALFEEATSDQVLFKGSPCIFWQTKQNSPLFRNKLEEIQMIIFQNKGFSKSGCFQINQGPK